MLRLPDGIEHQYYIDNYCTEIHNCKKCPIYGILIKKYEGAD